MANGLQKTQFQIEFVEKAGWGYSIRKLVASRTRPGHLCIFILDRPDGLVLFAFDFFRTGRLLPGSAIDELTFAWGQDRSNNREMQRGGVYACINRNSTKFLVLSHRKEFW